MSKKLILGALALILVLVSCAPGPNEMVNSTRVDEEADGFWQGLWHGIISPVTLVVSLFSRKVNIYEVHNNGNWYNVGFFFGLMMVLGGGGGGASRRSRRKRDR